MTGDRKKPGVAFWTTVVVVCLLLYPLSFGPACWLVEEAFVPGRTVAEAYRPLLAIVEYRERPRAALASYVGLFNRRKGERVLERILDAGDFFIGHGGNRFIDIHRRSFKWPDE
jgi:hypothetical protein